MLRLRNSFVDIPPSKSKGAKLPFQPMHLKQFKDLNEAHGEKTTYDFVDLNNSVICFNTKTFIFFLAVLIKITCAKFENKILSLWKFSFVILAENLFRSPQRLNISSIKF